MKGILIFQSQQPTTNANESLFPAVINNRNAKVSGRPETIGIRVPFKFFALNKADKGSVTIEASCIMPIILLVFLFIVWILRLFWIHAEIGSELYSVGNELVSYSYIYSNCFSQGEVDSSFLEELASIGFDEIFVLNKIKKTQASKQVEYLNALLSDVSTKDEIDIVITYYIKPLIKIPGISGVWLTNHFYSRAYIGKVFNTGDTQSDDPIVYITPTGRVYHTSLLCSSIKVTVSSTDTSNISSLRNSSEGKYYPCEVCCKKNTSGTVYVTPYGNRYHKSKNCSELKVTVNAVRLSEVGGRRKCLLCP